LEDSFSFVVWYFSTTDSYGWIITTWNSGHGEVHYEKCDAIMHQTNVGLLKTFNYHWLIIHFCWLI